MFKFTVTDTLIDIIAYREKGQSSESELRGRDFRRDLEDRERAVRDKRDRDRGRGKQSYVTGSETGQRR